MFSLDSSMKTNRIIFFESIYQIETQNDIIFIEY